MVGRRTLAAGVTLLALVGCTLTTSLDGFVGDGGAPATAGTSGTSGGTTSGSTSGATSGGTSGATSGGTSGTIEPDGGTPCTVASVSKRGTVADNHDEGAPWMNVSGALAPDNAYAHVDLPVGVEESRYLLITGFGFDIPGSATIRGVQMTILHRAVGGDTRTEDVTLTLNNDLRGAMKPDTDLPPVFGDAPLVFGGDSDRWGLTLHPNDINNPTFGAAYMAKNHEPTLPSSVDVEEISLTVTYCD